MKKIIYMFLLSFYLLIHTSVYADDFVIIPENNSTAWASSSLDAAAEAVKEVSSASAGSVWDTYNKKANAMRGNLWAQMASGVMNWDTLLNYIIYLVKFLSQLAMVIWAATFIYAWYVYGTSIFTWNANQWTKAVKHAVIWMIIVIFSYAIMKILTSMFLS